ncbi:type II toxin-antitoxin system ParD family antitoxin, partial [Enterobacter cloacae]|uniref:type II toxin-antitoxin system ParD family antitoxin n=1 Tax=Enterobacter cloacae TaxID=550 RepID=UPI000E49A328
MARTMTVDVGDELRDFIDALVKAGDYRTRSEVMRDALRLLREKQAESRLKELRDLLAEGIGSGDAKPWNKDTFLKNVRAAYSGEDERLFRRNINAL